MTTETKCNALMTQALWHLWLANMLLLEISRLRDGPAKAEPATPRNKDDPPAAPLVSLPADAEAAPSGSPSPPLSIHGQGMTAQSSTGEFLTNDKVEIRGLLGTNDNRELRINSKPPIRLDRREHAILVILARRAKNNAAVAHTGRNPVPSFVSAKAFVAIIQKFISKEGPLAGLWPYPDETDIYRSVHRLRSYLLEQGFNPNLIESGQKGAGYRLSTPPENIRISPDDNLYDKWLNGPADSGPASPKA